MALQGSTYSAWYNDPNHIRPTEVDTMLFRPLDTIANAVTPAVLLTSISTGEDQRLAFATLGTDNLIHVVHRILRYIPPLGQPRMPYDNITLATFGEVSALGVTTVEVPAGLFTRTPLLPRIRTIAATTQEATNRPLDMQLGTEGIPNEDVEEFRTRRATLIPSNLVGDILQATVEGLSPRSLWLNHVVPSLDRQGFRHEALPFIEWARVAYAGGVDGDNPIQLTPSLTPRHLELSLTTQRYTLLTRDFPTIPAPRGANDGHLVATAIGEFRADLAARDDSKTLRAALKRAADQRPSARWLNSTARLLRVCQVQDEGDLPPIWHALAAHGVKFDRTTIQYHLSLDIPRLDHISPPGSAAICSPELSKSLGQLAFQTTADEIQSGIHIFAVCYPTQDSRSKANLVAGLYDDQVQSVTGMTMEETVSLRTAQKFILPVGYVELQLVSCGYHRFLGTVLGPAHPVVTAFGLFVTSLKSDAIALHPYFDGNLTRTTGILRYIQLAMYTWLRKQINTDDIIAAPNFSYVFERIENRDWQIPAMPDAHCYTPPADRLSPKKTAPGAPPTKKASTVTVSAPANHLDPMVPINTIFDPKTFIKTHGPPPNNDKGGAMCLLYHIRGQCKQDCDRGSGPKTDHRRHSKPESERLLAYLNKAS